MSNAAETTPDAPVANQADIAGANAGVLDASAVVTPEGAPEAAESDTDPVVRKLRDEAAKYRTRAKDAENRVDELSREVFTLRVAALDKLADVTDLPYSADLLDDPDALAAAVDELISRRPHYAKRKAPNGSVGQGNRGDSATAPTFASLLQPAR